MSLYPNFRVTWSLLLEDVHKMESTPSNRSPQCLLRSIRIAGPLLQPIPITCQRGKASDGFCEYFFVPYSLFTHPCIWWCLPFDHILIWDHLNLRLLPNECRLQTRRENVKKKSAEMNPRQLPFAAASTGKRNFVSSCSKIRNRGNKGKK